MWHVLTVRPAAELSTAARLALAGYRTVAPVRQVWHRPVRYLRKSLTDAPLLTGYIFASGWRPTGRSAWLSCTGTRPAGSGGLRSR